MNEQVINLREYQYQEGYFSLDGAKKLISNLISRRYLGADFKIILDCSENKKIQHSALYNLSMFSYNTHIKITFSNIGWIRKLRYEKAFKKYERREKIKEVLSEKKEELTKLEKSLETRIQPFLLDYPPSSRGNIVKVLGGLLKIDLEYIESSIKDIKKEEKYRKKSKDTKLKLLIERSCGYEEDNLRALESKLLKLKEEYSKNNKPLEEATAFVFTELDKIGLIDGEEYKTLTIPFRDRDIAANKDLENMLSDLIGLIRFIYDSKEKYEWQFIKNSEAVKVSKIFRKLLEKRSENIFRKYNKLVRL